METPQQKRRVSHKDWLAEGVRLFGTAVQEWKFRCPSCGHIQTPEDFDGVEGVDNQTAFISCIGRWTGAMETEMWPEGGGPCNYAGRGLFRLNPVVVVDEDGDEHDVFDFAHEDAWSQAA